MKDQVIESNNLLDKSQNKVFFDLIDTERNCCIKFELNQQLFGHLQKRCSADQHKVGNKLTILSFIMLRSYF